MHDDIKPYFVTLPGRGLIHIEGEDRIAFLQNLVTNDLENIENHRIQYACLLTPQGKFLHDFFVMAASGFLLLDCEGGARAQDLYKRLNLYRLRSKVKISVEDHHPVYAGFGPAPPFALPDPRHPDMGWRSFEKPEDMGEKDFSTWDRHRIELAIPDGSRDMVPEASTMIESNIDRLNGISMKKGCYIGQELTARMHYRGLAKKRLYAIRGNSLPESGVDIEIDGKLAGQMRSRSGDIGLALLKHEFTAETAQKVAPFEILC